MQYAHSILTTASPETIWKLWTDVKNWKSWDEAVQDSTITGDFKTDAEGMVTSEKGPKAKFTIASCTPNFSYTLDTKLLFAHLYVRRLIGYHNNKSIITNEIWIEGPLSSFWWTIIGKKYLAMLPNIMDRFKKIAESIKD